MSSAFDSLHHVLDVLKRRWLALAVMIAAGVGAGFYALETMPEYTASSAVLLVSPPQSGAAPASIAATDGLNAVDLPSLLMSSSVAGDVRRRLNPHQRPDVFAARIGNQVAPGGNVMTITFRAKSRDQALYGANDLADRMSAYYRQMAGARYVELDRYLTREMATRVAAMRDIDRRLEAAADRNPLVGQTQPLNALTTALLTLESRRGQVDASLRGHLAEARYDGQQLALLQPTVQRELEQNDASYKALELQVGTDSAKLDAMRSQYVPTYPGIASMQDQVRQEAAALRDQQAVALKAAPGGSPTYLAAVTIRNQAESALSADRAQLAAIDEQIARTLASLHELSERGADVSSLQMQRSAAEAAFQALSLRRANALADEEQGASAGSIVVIDRAVKADTALGKHTASTLGAAIASFTVLGITLAFLLEVLDRRVRTLGAVSALYGKPILGTVGVR